MGKTARGRVRVAIVQSNYIPWAGYFQLIAKCDLFIFLDDVQYTRRDWRNRNKIRTKQGDRWLTIPLKQSGNYEARIDEMTISDQLWGTRHFDTLAASYRSAPGWKRYADALEWCYIDSPERLSLINRSFIELGMQWLGVATPLAWSTQYESHGTKSVKLVDLFLACGATVYLSGPSARDYLDEKLFNDHGIAVEWMEYGDWPRLSFLHVLFVSGESTLSILPR